MSTRHIKALTQRFIRRHRKKEAEEKEKKKSLLDSWILGGRSAAALPAKCQAVLRPCRDRRLSAGNYNPLYHRDHEQFTAGARSVPRFTAPLERSPNTPHQIEVSRCCQRGSKKIMRNDGKI